MHHLASCLLSILHASCMVSYKGDLYKLLLVQDMAAPTIPVSAKENLGDTIEIRVDIIHLEPVVAVACPVASVIKTMEAIETITRSQEKRVRMEMVRQLASVQGSQRLD
ncbi:hypothetical protein Tco_1347832 [Tanacetum coccineum]